MTKKLVLQICIMMGGAIASLPAFAHNAIEADSLRSHMLHYLFDADHAARLFGAVTVLVALVLLVRAELRKFS